MGSSKHIPFNLSSRFRRYSHKCTPFGHYHWQEACAYTNVIHIGLDFYTPNISIFLDPCWGRGQEMPTEDAHCAQGYITALISGLQETTPPSKYIIVTNKHYAGYDVETNRSGQSYDRTQQDLI